MQLCFLQSIWNNLVIVATKLTFNRKKVFSWFSASRMKGRPRDWYMKSSESRDSLTCQQQPWSLQLVYFWIIIQSSTRRIIFPKWNRTSTWTHTIIAYPLPLACWLELHRLFCQSPAISPALEFQQGKWRSHSSNCLDPKRQPKNGNYFFLLHEHIMTIGVICQRKCFLSKHIFFPRERPIRWNS